MNYQFNTNRPRGFLANTPVVIRNIIIINAVMLLLTLLNRPFMVEHFALFYPGSPFFRPHQVITHMFMHGGIGHLLFNMYALWIFGEVLERMWKPQRFLLFYLVTGLGAAALHMGVQYLEADSLTRAVQAGSSVAFSKYQALMGTPTVGASGAIYGVLLAFAMLFPNTELRLIFTPFAFKAKYMVIAFAVIELALGVIGGGNVAHFAHLGGMLFGLLLILYWKKKGRLYY